MIISIFLFIVLFAFGMVFPTSKKAAFFILLYMWIFYSFNTFSGDYEVYRTFYEETEISYMFAHFEPGFAAIMAICRRFSLPFLGFKIVLGTVFIGLLYYVVSIYTKRRAMVLALFMIFPFMLYTSVLRAGISMMFVTMSFKYLSSRRNYSLLRFSICIIVATLFHYSSFLFLVFILLRRQRFGKVLLWSVVATLTIALLMYTGVLYNLASKVISNVDILEWLDVSAADNNLNIKGKLVQVMVLFFVIAIMYTAQHSIYLFKKNNPGVHIQRREIRLIRAVFKSNLMLVVFIPFFMLNDSWLRMIWALMLIDIIVCVIVFSKRRFRLPRSIVVKRSTMALATTFAFLVLCVAYTNFPYMNTEVSVENYFINNIIFQEFLF